jgi:hypothetical protein
MHPVCEAVQPLLEPPAPEEPAEPAPAELPLPLVPQATLASPMATAQPAQIAERQDVLLMTLLQEKR